MNTVRKKHTANKEEPVVVSDVVTKTTERIEIIKEDPLTDFKEKMTEEEESPISDMPAKKNFMWPILFIFITALVLLGGGFIYKQGANKAGKINVVSLSKTPVLIPEPTITIDLSKYAIKILNGSGVAGEATKQKSNLESKGFTVSSIGNAAKSDYTDTIIQAKKEVDRTFLDKLKSVLETSFALGEIKELQDDSQELVIVIIGSSSIGQ